MQGGLIGLKTVSGLATAISTEARIKAVLDYADERTLQFEDGSSVTVKLANPGVSVAVRACNSAVKYLG